jgi:hypothetical protein
MQLAIGKRSPNAQEKFYVLPSDYNLQPRPCQPCYPIHGMRPLRSLTYSPCSPAPVIWFQHSRTPIMRGKSRAETLSYRISPLVNACKLRNHIGHLSLGIRHAQKREWGIVWLRTVLTLLISLATIEAGRICNSTHTSTTAPSLLLRPMAASIPRIFSQDRQRWVFVSLDQE